MLFRGFPEDPFRGTRFEEGFSGFTLANALWKISRNIHTGKCSLGGVRETYTGKCSLGAFPGDSYRGMPFGGNPGAHVAKGFPGMHIQALLLKAFPD